MGLKNGVTSTRLLKLRRFGSRKPNKPNGTQGRLVLSGNQISAVGEGASQRFARVSSATAAEANEWRLGT
jgi:hypothetical protein